MALGLPSLLRDLGEEAEIVLATYSSAAKAIAERLGLGSQRHIEVQFLWIQQQVRLKIVSLEKVRTDKNPADLLTKFIEETKAKHAITLHGV